MAIIINLDVMLAKRKVKSKELSEFVRITEQNLSLIKTGKVKGFRLATLNASVNSFNANLEIFLSIVRTVSNRLKLSKNIMNDNF